MSADCRNRQFSLHRADIQRDRRKVTGRLLRRSERGLIRPVVQGLGLIGVVALRERRGREEEAGRAMKRIRILAMVVVSLSGACNEPQPLCAWLRRRRAMKKV